MRSFTVRFGDQTGRLRLVEQPDGWIAVVLKNGVQVVAGVPEVVDGPGLKFTMPDDTTLVAYPNGEMGTRTGAVTQEPVGSLPAVSLSDQMLTVYPGVVSVTGWPVVWGARIVESRPLKNLTSAQIKGVVFADGVGTEVRWTAELTALPRGCGSCGGRR